MSARDTLDNFRLFGPSGLRVSPLCLGTMTFGTEWGWGSEKDESQRIFDTYIDRGGNFIDTANYYTSGTSEEYIGEFIRASTSYNRDQLVLATKYTLAMQSGDPNSGGNHRKNMMRSVEESLRRLQTDYIDLYWVHMWEGRTPIEEVLRGLDDLVSAGKILYVGMSDTPGWKVAQAQTIASFRGWAPLIALQLEYNLLERGIERDLVPCAEEFDLAITPWSPLGGGVLTGKYNQKTIDDSLREQIMQKGINERKLSIAAEVVRVAEELGRTPAQVALRWVLEQPTVVSPIFGARTLAQLDDNLTALEFELPPEAADALNTASEIDLGFPHTFLSKPAIQERIAGGTTIQPR